MEQTKQIFAKRNNNFESKRKSAIIANSKTVNKNSYKLNKSNNKIRNDAITELELIYEKLNIVLNDEQLLDRAERRDLPFNFQLNWNKDINHIKHIENINHLNDAKNDSINKNQYLSEIDLKVKSKTDNKFDKSYETFNKRRSIATIEALLSLRNDNNNYGSKREDMITRSRTPPYRRSAIPDIITDDFAFRKYNKSLSHNNLCPKREIKGFNTNNRINSNKNSNSMSYLLIMSSNNDEIDYNNHKNSNNNDLKYLSEANVKFDDLSHRRMRQSFAANVLPPHPPFGIPNNFVSHSTHNDYIRAELDPKEFNKVRFRCKTNVPHLIHDDMAFRSFRKESLTQNKSTINRSLSNQPSAIPPLPLRLSPFQP